MANTLTPVTTGLTIFGQEILARLRKKIAFIMKINRDIQGAGEFARDGQTIQIPVVSISGGMNTRAIGGGTTQDDAAVTQVPVTMTQVYKALSGIDNLELTLTNVNLMDTFAEQMAQILAEGIEDRIYNLWSQIPYQVGKTDNTAAFNATDKFGALADAAKIALDNKWLAGDRYGILTSAEGANIKKLDNFIQAYAAGSAEGRSSGFLGKILGFNMDEANAPTSFTLTGSTAWGTPLVNGVQAIGVTTLAVKGLAATGTLKAGSIFVGGREQLHPHRGRHNFREHGDRYPERPLKTAVTDGQAITVTGYTHGAANSASGISLLFHPQFGVFTTRRESPFPQGSGVLEVQITDPVSGVNFRLMVESNVQGSSGNAFQTKLTMSALIGTAVVRPELAVRLAGQ
jgi:hypothetical protein